MQGPAQALLRMYFYMIGVQLFRDIHSVRGLVPVKSPPTQKFNIQNLIKILPFYLQTSKGILTD